MKKLLILLLTLQTTAVYADEIDAEFVKRFSTLPTYNNAQVSPDGKIISAKLKIDDKWALAFFDVNNFELISVIPFKNREEVGSYFWVNNERVVIDIAITVGTLVGSFSTGQYFSINYDKSNPAYIFGFRKETSASRKTVVDKTSYGYVIDEMDDDPDHILLATFPRGRFTTGPRPTIVRVNVYNGGQKNFGRVPLGGSYVLTDSTGEPRFAVGESTKAEAVVITKSRESQNWTEISRSKIAGGSIVPLEFIENDTKVLVLDDTESSTAKIKSINLVNGEQEVIFHHPKYDPSPQILDDEVIAVSVAPGYEEVYWLDDNTEIGQIARAAMGYFNDGNIEVANKAWINVSSITKDRTKAIVVVGDDVSSPKYYLFDLDKGRMTFLFNMWPEIEESNLAKSLPIKFTASDGLTIHGYFTNARNVKDGKKPPLIVLPHGGPIGPRDDWGFDPDVHILSNAGYAVLKVNFRGSGGFGRDFIKAGMGEWGDGIQRDIIEGTEWVIEQGWVDGDRVGIYGGSFGGYSAVQAPILRPDLFKAAVAYIGVFDLEMLYKEGDIPASFSGKAALEQLVGDDKNLLKRTSPVNSTHKLEAPLLIVSGKEDERAPVEQAYALERALKANNKEYELIIVDKEGHGFRDPENREMFYLKMLEHFNSNL